MHESVSSPARPPRQALTFDRFIRRTHLYSAMALLPWFLMFGLSSCAINHNTWFGGSGGSSIRMTPIIDRTFDAGPPPAAADFANGAKPGVLQKTDEVLQFAERIQVEAGLKGRGLIRLDDKGRIVMPLYSFWAASEVTYDPASKNLVVKSFPYNIANMLVTMHVHHGFEGPFWLDMWAVMIDVVVVVILIWITSGLIMWWRLKKVRGRGWLALGAGTATFAGFLIGL